MPHQCREGRAQQVPVSMGAAGACTRMPAPVAATLGAGPATCSPCTGRRTRRRRTWGCSSTDIHGTSPGSRHLHLHGTRQGAMGWPPACGALTHLRAQDLLGRRRRAWKELQRLLRRLVRAGGAVAALHVRRLTHLSRLCLGFTDLVGVEVKQQTFLQGEGDRVGVCACVGRLRPVCGGPPDGQGIEGLTR